MMAAEGTDDQNEARKAAAAQIVAERQRHQHHGMTDWNGDSRPYRAVIEKAYRDAGVPSDTEAKVLHAGLRYHVRKAVRKAAPASDQAKLAGLRPKRPTGPEVVDLDKLRMPTILADALDDPVGLVKLAIRSLEAARSLKPRGAEAETIRYMIKTLRDAVRVLAETVGDTD